MTLTITSPNPITLFPTSASEIDGDFAFSYTTFGAFISPEGTVEIGTDTVTDPTTHQQYKITFNADFAGLSYGSGTGMQSFSIQIPAKFFDLVQTDFVEYQVTLCELDPNTFAVKGLATKSIDLFIEGTGTPPPPPPPDFTPKQKEQFRSDADTLDLLSKALSDLGAATDPLHPAAKALGQLASQLADAINSQVGTVNSYAQQAVSFLAGLFEESPGFNPIAWTLNTAASIDSLAAKLLKLLAHDPADGNFTSVYHAPDWNFGSLTGASATANTLLVDSWKLLQDAANALEASERYQGAEFAKDTASQSLQNTAFNDALSAYDAQRKVVSADLHSYLAELQTSISDINLSTGTSLADAQSYLKGLANPLTDDPILKAFISSIDATAPNLATVIDSVANQALSAFETMQDPALTGSAFAALSAGADQLASSGIAPASIQADYLGIVRGSLPTDQATTVADAINAGTSTETQFINGLLSQVADTTIPVVAVEASMYGAVGSSAVITNLVTNFLPKQIAYANQSGLDPQVFACLETALVFAFGNESGSHAFANNYGPSNTAMPATHAGDAAFAAAAATAIFGSAQTANTANALLGYVNFLEDFFTANGIVGVQNPTADQIVIAARAGAWGEGVAIALENNLGALPGQVTNFLEDTAQGTAIYSAPLSSQPNHAPFQGSATASAATTASSVQVTGLAAHVDHIVM